VNAKAGNVRHRGGHRSPRADAIPLRGSGHRRDHGFTLLELALALMIMGILLTLAVPRLPRLGRTDLEASADRLASTMTYLADEASLRGRIYRLTLDMDADRWTVAALAPFAAPGTQADKPEFHEDADDPLARSVVLPRGVSLEAVIDHDGQSSTGSRAVYFLPEGLTENLSVRLVEDEGGSTTVVLDAGRGSARREDTDETQP
jgi:prepilin-type N-terminal cleavage/methylation domain-containing protein